MKKYYILLLLCIVAVTNASAQILVLRSQAKKTEKKIDQINKKGANDLKFQLRTVKKRLKNQEISKEEADSLNIYLVEKNKKEIQKQVNLVSNDLKELRAERKKITEEGRLSRSAIGKAITAIIIDEKVALKKEIEAINNRLEENEITKNEADNLKKETAEKHAKVIENKISEEELKVENQLQEFTDRQIANISVDSVEVEIKDPYYPDKKIRTMKMTPEGLSRYKKNIEKWNKIGFFEAGVIAFGLNNVMLNGKTSSDYKTWSSKFYEYGYTYKHRLTENYSPFYLRYGASLLFNNLKAENNLYLVK